MEWLQRTPLQPSPDSSRPVKPPAPSFRATTESLVPVPKKRTSRSVRNIRRSHDHLAINHHAVQDCPNCGNLSQRHHVCPSCGFYKGRAVFQDADAGSAEASS